MAKLIKQIHDLVDVATDKGLTNHWSRDQIDACIYGAVTSLVREQLPDFPKTDRSRNYLLPFQRKTTITLTSGIGDIPADFEKEHEFYISGGNKVHVTIVERGFWSSRRQDPIDPPTTTGPIGTIYREGTGATGRKIELAPTSIAAVDLLYIKTPTMPNYGTTINLGQEVYDDTASTDVDHSALLHDIIFERALRPMGLSINNGQLVRVSDVADQKFNKA